MKIRTLLLTLILLAGCACSTQPQWHLVWEENFDGPEIDGSIWTRIPRGSSDWPDMMSLRADLAFIKQGQLVLLGKAGADDDETPFVTGGIASRGKKTFK